MPDDEQEVRRPRIVGCFAEALHALAPQTLEMLGIQIRNFLDAIALVSGSNAQHDRVVRYDQNAQHQGLPIELPVKEVHIYGSHH